MELPPGLRLSVEKNPSWEDRDLIDNGLGAHNAVFLRDNSYDYFGIFLRGDAGAIHAGLIGHIYAGWLFVNNLWVHTELRGQGIGRELMARAEQRAAALGCHSAYLDTFSFQAPGFYQKLGYTVFGTLNYPPDHKRFFLQKRLQSSAG